MQFLSRLIKPALVVRCCGIRAGNQSKTIQSSSAWVVPSFSSSPLYPSFISSSLSSSYRSQCARRGILTRYTGPTDYSTYEARREKFRKVWHVALFVGYATGFGIILGQPIAKYYRQYQEEHNPDRFKFRREWLEMRKKYNAGEIDQVEGTIFRTLGKVTIPVFNFLESLPWPYLPEVVPTLPNWIPKNHFDVQYMWLSFVRYATTYLDEWDKSHKKHFLDETQAVNSTARHLQREGAHLLYRFNESKEGFDDRIEGTSILRNLTKQLEYARLFNRPPDVPDVVPHQVRYEKEFGPAPHRKAGVRGIPLLPPPGIDPDLELRPFTLIIDERALFGHANHGQLRAFMSNDEGRVYHDLAGVNDWLAHEARMNMAFQEMDDSIAPTSPNPYPPERLIKRAGADFFLSRMSTLYEIVLWRSSPSMETLEKIDPTAEFVDFHIGPQRLVEGLKDLRDLNRDLSKTILIDVDPANVSLNPDNTIWVPEWSGFEEEEKKPLVELASFLTEFAQADIPAQELDLPYTLQYIDESKQWNPRDAFALTESSRMLFERMRREKRKRVILSDPYDIQRTRDDVNPLIEDILKPNPRTV